MEAIVQKMDYLSFSYLSDLKIAARVTKDQILTQATNLPFPNQEDPEVLQRRRLTSTQRSPHQPNGHGKEGNCGGPGVSNTMRKTRMVGVSSFFWGAAALWKSRDSARARTLQRDLSW